MKKLKNNPGQMHAKQITTCKENIVVLKKLNGKLTVYTQYGICIV